jgi:AcrR family transcriptional regulator
MSRSYRAPVRAARAEASRRAILDAAERRFTRDGYVATTLTGIAEEAGLAVETLYKHFGNKATILEQLHVRAFGGGEGPSDGPPGLSPQDLEHLAGEPDAEARLTALVGDLAERFAATAGVQRLFVEAAGADPALRARWEANRQRRLEDTRRVLELFAADGSLGVPLDEAVDLAWGLASPDLYLLLVVDRGWNRGRYERWLADTLRAQLLGGPEGGVPARDAGP